ncbi:hypothetical protein KUTeg_016188 [Tegillarca granosa]|uniref:Uncharacterized protein n=1 Tax=Tegillarca granosa TaxID=220873 RepID=A0ABQ9EK50_TEGGR|nr:hypothetical protein KUTeg_016188 [Tegillarca granosa]
MYSVTHKSVFVEGVLVRTVADGRLSLDLLNRNLPGEGNKITLTAYRPRLYSLSVYKKTESLYISLSGVCNISVIIRMSVDVLPPKLTSRTCVSVSSTYTSNEGDTEYAG